MRTTKMLVATTATAICAFAAFAAPAATAQIEVTDEHSEEHCEPVELTAHVPTGGCHVAAETEPETTLNLEAHVPGLGELAQIECTNSFDARIQETGHGFIYNQVLNTEDEACNLEPCEENPGTEPHPSIPWPFYIYEFVNTKVLNTTFCFVLAGSQEGNPAFHSVCTIAVPFEDEELNHDYEFQTLPVVSGGGIPQSRCSQNGFASLEGHWVLEDIENEEIEITHEED